MLGHCQRVGLVTVAAFKCLKIFQLTSSEPDPVEAGQLYMIKPPFFFFFSWWYFLPCSLCFPGINFVSNLSFLIRCGVWKFSVRWFSLNSHHPAWFPCWAEHSFRLFFNCIRCSWKAKYSSWKLQRQQRRIKSMYLVSNPTTNFQLKCRVYMQIFTYLYIIWGY